MSSNIYNVLIAGAGNIGAFFDRPGADEVLTHAHAFSMHPGFNLLGFYDARPSAAVQAARLWGGRAFQSINDVLENEQIDVLCLAVPDEYHFQYLQELSNSSLKLILAEKPLVSNWKEAEEIQKLYEESPVELAINYSRRYVPEFRELRNYIQSGSGGDYLSGNAYYGKGLVHNGSHLLDLLGFLLGKFNCRQVFNSRVDYYPDDPSVSAILQLESGSRFILQTLDCRAYSLWEMDLLFSSRRIRIIDSGFLIEEYEVKQDALFPGYKTLLKTSSRNTALNRCMYHTAVNIYEHLEYGQELYCSLPEGVQVIKICQQLQEGLIK